MIRTRRERVELSIMGGRPWGFSLKGGVESNKPLTISKLEKGGKAESAGLFVGDIPHSINSVVLTGSRNEAVQLVKMSGSSLIIEVERGSYTNRPRPYSVGPGTFTSGAIQTFEEDYAPCEPHSRPSSQVFDVDQSETRTESTFSQSSYSTSNLSASNSSIHERTLSPQGGGRFEAASYASAHLRNSCYDIRDQTRGLESKSGGHGDMPQPAVRLRTKKARDRGLPTERPRSWHASKHPDPAYLYEQSSMRSPGSGCLAGPTPAPRYYQQHHVPPQRRSKGWCESGDLKSTYRPEVNGSRDSVISADSHRSSYRSGRLSVSSSRSSGTMSSSRGSLDNLLDNPATRPNLENYPQPVVLSSKHKQSAPSHHPQSGIVSQKMNIFERLSHDSALNIDSKGSREDLDRVHRFRQTPDDVEKEKRYRENPKSPPQQSHFSFSPPTVSKFSEKPLMHKKSREELVTKPETNQKARVSPTVGSGITYSDAKIVKTTSFDPYRNSPQAVPEPPQRDKSSAMAVKSHIRPNAQSQHENRHRTSTSPPSAYNRSPGKPTHHHSASTSYLEPTHRITVTRPIDKTLDGNAGRQERMFGVMSVGSRGNIVATSVTVSPNVGLEKVSRKPSLPNGIDTVPRYENVRDFASVGDDARKMANDYLSRAELKANEKASCHNAKPDHSKSHSDDSTEANLKGKYGSVWKTPQSQHNRARSANFSSVLQDWTDRESENTKSTSNTDKELEMNYLNKKISDTSIPALNTSENAVSCPENTPSVLRSLQNTQRSERRSKNQDGKTNNYDKLWLSESKPPAKAEPRAKMDWKYKNVELGDDPFSTSNRYADDIKEKSQQVLRETSFKRKSFDVSPSMQSLAHKKNVFQQSHSEQKDLRASILTRSRSIGNELEDESESVSVGKDRKSHVGKPRPKSAGVFRSRVERPVPATRNVAPCQRPKIDHRKSDSLPDDDSKSLGYDDLSRLSNSSKSYQNRRVSIDVKPDPTCVSGAGSNGIISNRRSQVIDFFNRNSVKNDSTRPSHYTSMINITTASYDETSEKQKFDRERMAISSKERNQKRRSPPGHVNGSRVQHLIENETPKSHLNKPEYGSVRKLKNFKEARAKFSKSSNMPLSRAKSTSSLLDDESPKSTSESQSSFVIKSGDRSTSFENMLDCSSDASIAPSSNGTRTHDEYPHPSIRGHRSKSSPLITSVPAKEEMVVPPPRKHTKNHRQRISNSSSTSSATTISTMSSLSSTSNASIGIFPTVGEENERTFKDDSPQDSSSTSLSVISGSDSSSQHFTENRSSSRIPIDTNTYRVPKRKSKEKSSSKSRESSENLQKSEDLEKFPTPPESLISELPQSGANSYSKSLIAPPPLSQPLDGTAEKLLEKLVEKRKSHDLPPPPSVPSKSIFVHREQISEEVRAQPTPSEQRKSSIHDKSLLPEQFDPAKRASSGFKYENVHIKEGNQQYENVFSPNRTSSVPAATAEESSSKAEQLASTSSETISEQKEIPPSRPSITISSEPLLPDVSFLPDSISAATLEEEHPDLTRDIIKGDKALAQVLTTSSKKTIDFMSGVLSQPSHHIVEEGMRYRRRKPAAQTTENQTEMQFEALLQNDIAGHDNLPASSTYYKTSASKAKILNLMKEKMADGEIPDEEQESLDETNHKKVELVLSIKKKLDDLHSMRGLLEVEMKENECLGKQVFNLTKSMCTPKEQDKYNTLVQEVDKIINLLLSLSGRLARVENTIQMLPPDADKQEMEILCEKRKKLTEQHNDAKQLKESIDKRQKAVSEILAGYFNQEQFADYEHYIKMKSALIMEQRELDDKTKLGQEQMQCLRDSLPEEWQNNLDKLLDE